MVRWRRALLACVFGLAPFVTPARADESAARPFSLLPPADLSKLSPSDFADDELDLPFYLAHFHDVANSVVETGPHRGFIAIPVWRSTKDNQPYNARIMENVLSLAYFYATRRPWNPFYGSPALRARLEAALSFWCASPDPQGRFSEYGPGETNLAATAFATKFMAEALRLLKEGPPVDEVLRRRVRDTMSRTIRFVLTDETYRSRGADFTNQYTNVWAGGLAFLRLYPDAELEALLRRRIKEDAPRFQSPAGYFYEKRGPDFGYNLGTHHSNLSMVAHYAFGSDLWPVVMGDESRFAEWLAYNAVPQPDGSGFVLNRAVETRQQHPFLDRTRLLRGQEAQGHRLLGAEVPLARAFLASREERAAEIARRRAELTKAWPRVRELVRGEFNAFSPYAFLHRAQAAWYPNEVERQAALRMLPVWKAPFLHQRMDSREPVVFTYVRQPAYYAAFNSGRQLTEQQRYGLGLFWVPEAGALLQNQTGSDRAAWGTAPARAEEVYEAATLSAVFEVGGQAVTLQPGNRDLPSGALEVRYPLGTQGDKTLRFDAQALHVDVRHTGAFREQIPLLLAPGEKIALTRGGATLTRGGRRIAVRFDPAARPDTAETGLSVGPLRVVVLTLNAHDRLAYRFLVESP